MFCSLEQINTWQLKAIYIMAIIAFITQLARVIDIICIRYKLIGSAYYGRVGCRIALLIWNIIDLVIAGLILSGSEFLYNVWVCSFTGYFIADFLELAQYWDSHPKAFRDFIIKHHTLGILLAIIWSVLRPKYPFPEIQAAGALIWHSSAVLVKFPMLYKAVCTRNGSKFTNFKAIHRMNWVIFLLQRVWRFGIIAVVACSGVLETHLSAFLLGFIPATCMDLFDIYYQVKGLRKPEDGKKEEIKEPAKLEEVKVESPNTEVAIEVAA